MSSIIRYDELPRSIEAISPSTRTRRSVLNLVFLFKATLDGYWKGTVVDLLVAFERVEEAHELLCRVGMRYDKNKFATILDTSELLYNKLLYHSSVPIFALRNMLWIIWPCLLLAPQHLSLESVQVLFIEVFLLFSAESEAFQRRPFSLPGCEETRSHVLSHDPFHF